jgi:hypothetical protein
MIFNVFPFLFLLGIAVVVVGGVYLGASIYYRYKTSKWDENIRKAVTPMVGTVTPAARSDHQRAIKEGPEGRSGSNNLSGPYANATVNGRSVNYATEPTVDEKIKQMILESGNVSADDMLEKLFVRCKIAVEQRMGTKALLRLERIYHKALSIIQEEDDDEAFYLDTVTESATGPKPVSEDVAKAFKKASGQVRFLDDEGFFVDEVKPRTKPKPKKLKSKKR